MPNIIQYYLQRCLLQLAEILLQRFQSLAHDQFVLSSHVRTVFISEFKQFCHQSTQTSLYFWDKHWAFWKERNISCMWFWHITYVTSCKLSVLMSPMWIWFSKRLWYKHRELRCQSCHTHGSITTTRLGRIFTQYHGQIAFTTVVINVTVF